MSSVKEEFATYMKTFMDFEREVLVTVQNGENRLSSVLTVTDWCWNSGILTVTTLQQGMELDWTIHCGGLTREGSHFVLEEIGGGQIMFFFYDLFSKEDPYWE